MSVEDVVLDKKFNIDSLLKQAAARAAEDSEPDIESDHDDDESDVPSLDKLSPLPRPGDPYKAYSRPPARPVASLSLLKADGAVWTYPYSCRVEGPHMVPAKDADNSLVVVLKFSGLTGIVVTLTGRRLEQMTNYLAAHRIAWVREQ